MSDATTPDFTVSGINGMTPPSFSSNPSSPSAGNVIYNTTDNKLKFYKVKKFQCKSLKGRGAKSGIRIIYAYFPKEQRIIFLEIYFKAKQENENRQRIKDFIKSLI